MADDIAALLLDRLGDVSLAALARDVERRRPAGPVLSTPCLNESARHVARP